MKSLPMVQIKRMVPVRFSIRINQKDLKFCTISEIGILVVSRRNVELVISWTYVFMDHLKRVFVFATVFRGLYLFIETLLTRRTDRIDVQNLKLSTVCAIQKLLNTYHTVVVYIKNCLDLIDFLLMKIV